MIVFSLSVSGAGASALAGAAGGASASAGGAGGASASAGAAGVSTAADVSAGAAAAAVVVVSGAPVDFSTEHGRQSAFDDLPNSERYVSTEHFVQLFKPLSLAYCPGAQDAQTPGES